MYIDEWQWDDGNLDELARHGLSRRIVERVGEEIPRFRRNKRGRAATHQMIGPDDGGTIWTICIGELPSWPGVWRAITGWKATPAEIGWYERSR